MRHFFQEFAKPLRFFLLCSLLLGSNILHAVPTLKGIRIGDFQGNTRIVLELNEHISCEAALAKGQEDLLVRLPYSIKLSMPNRQALKKSILTNYYFIPRNKLNPPYLRFEAEEKLSLLNSFALSPSSASLAHRCVFDLKGTKGLKGKILSSKQQETQPARPEFKKNVLKTSQTPQSQASEKKLAPITSPEKPNLHKEIYHHKGERIVQETATVSYVKGKPQETLVGEIIVLPKHKPLFEPKKVPLKTPVIIIDAGHGGKDPGSLSASGFYEKFVTLAFAQELKRQLEATKHFKVYLTRERDYFIPLTERVKKARKLKGDLFLSLHADSHKNKEICGLSVYTLSKVASDKESAALAEKENKADLIMGIDISHESLDVQNILIDLAQRETMNGAVQFAHGLVRNLKPHVKTLDNTHRFANFAVLKAPDVASVLIELGYLSNKKDEANLRQPGYQRRLCQLIVKNVEDYFKLRSY